MSREVMMLALEALGEYVNVVVSVNDPNEWTPKVEDAGGLAREAITALRKALAEQPAQQEPKIDIYRSFEQWKSGNVLEHGVPRTEYYSEAQLDLVEMGWHYGYDAGRAVEQALDKKAENARELGLDYEPAQQEPVAWPCLIAEADFSKDTVTLAMQCTDYKVSAGKYWLSNTPPAQRTWVGLTDEEIDKTYETKVWDARRSYARAIEAKLKEKNT